MSWSSFVYRQIKGVCRDVGGATDVPQRVRLRTGGEMLLDIRDSQQRHIYYSRLYEYRSISGIKKFLQPGDSFIDVGANIGFYSIWAALRLGSAGRVYSFEPNPKAYSYLRRNVELNNLENINLHQVALGASEGTVQLETRFDDLALSRVVRSATGTEVVNVPSKRLDTCFSETEKAKIKFIKIDAEGAEPEILQGGETILEKRPDLLVEVDERRLAPSGSSEEALLALLTRYEYVPFKLNSMGQLVPFKLSARRPVWGNLFFTPRERALK